MIFICRLRWLEANRPDFFQRGEGGDDDDEMIDRTRPVTRDRLPGGAPASNYLPLVRSSNEATGRAFEALLNSTTHHTFWSHLDVWMTNWSPVDRLLTPEERMLNDIRGAFSKGIGTSTSLEQFETLELHGVTRDSSSPISIRPQGDPENIVKFMSYGAISID